MTAVFYFQPENKIKTWLECTCSFITFKPKHCIYIRQISARLCRWKMRFDTTWIVEDNFLVLLKFSNRTEMSRVALKSHCEALERILLNTLKTSTVQKVTEDILDLPAVHPGSEQHKITAVVPWCRGCCQICCRQSSFSASNIKTCLSFKNFLTPLVFNWLVRICKAIRTVSWRIWR